MASRFVVYRDTIADRSVAGAVERPVLTQEFGSAFLTQTVRVVGPGSTGGPYESGEHEEVLFVLTGTGALLLGDQEIDFAPESGMLIVPGETYRLRADSATEIVVVN